LDPGGQLEVGDPTQLEREKERTRESERERAREREGEGGERETWRQGVRDCVNKRERI
jgi:hypothetical protein